MDNRIRELRKKKGWTIKELAARVGTSEATVSRLETHQIAMSVDWLERFAEALHIAPSDLLTRPDPGGVEFIGVIGKFGRLTPIHGASFNLDAPVKNALAVRMNVNEPPFFAGDYVLATKYPLTETRRLLNRFCLAAVDDDALRIGRLAILAPQPSGKRPMILMPQNPLHPIVPENKLKWIAAISMRISHFDHSDAAHHYPR